MLYILRQQIGINMVFKTMSYLILYSALHSLASKLDDQVLENSHELLSIKLVSRMLRHVYTERLLMFR